jgi:hypothetical protein
MPMKVKNRDDHGNVGETHAGDVQVLGARYRAD